MGTFSDLRRKFAVATPAQKRFWLLTGAGVGIVVVLFGLASLKSPPPKKLSDRTDSKIIAPPKKNVDLESIFATVTNVQRQLLEMQSRQNRADEAVKEQAARFNGQMQDVVAGKIGGDGLSKEVDGIVLRKIERMKIDGLLPSNGASTGTAVKTGGALGAPLAPDSGMGPLMPAQAVGEGAEEKVTKRRKLKMVTAEEAKPDVASSSDPQKASAPVPHSPSTQLANGMNGDTGRNQANAIARDRRNGADPQAGAQTWVPAGSIITGVLITGMDAPASQASQKQPTPALVRIKLDATLPNSFTVDIKECFVLISGYGQLSSERAMLRTERMTCVRPDGGVIEATMDGYITGEDGKAGMRGRLVTKEGALIARTMSAGILGALGHRLGGNNTGGGGFSIGGQQGGAANLTLGTLGDSAANGLGASFAKVADFYLEMAKETVPVIEIDAGRQVTIILVRGVSIKNTKS